MRIDLPLCSFKDCRYNFDGNCNDKGRKEKCEFDMYKKSAEEQPKIGGWIPCSERLPTKKECGNYRGHFLVTVYTNKLTTLYMEYEYTTIRGKEVGRWLWNDRVNIPWEVIAWQPLPEAYHGQMD